MNSTAFTDYFATAKEQFDLTAAEDQTSLLRLSESLLQQSEWTLEALESAARLAEAPLEFRLAVKLVTSRTWMLANKQPLKVGVVFAMWGEHHRLLPRSN